MCFESPVLLGVDLFDVEVPDKSRGNLGDLQVSQVFAGTLVVARAKGEHIFVHVSCSLDV